MKKERERLGEQERQERTHRQSDTTVLEWSEEEACY